MFRRRRILVAVAFTCLAPMSVLAAEEYGVEQGLIGVSGSASAAIQHGVEDPDSQTSSWSIRGTVSYFVADPISIDATPSFSGNFDGDAIEEFHLGATGYFLPRQRFTPFLRGGLGFTHFDFEQSPYSPYDEWEGSYFVGAGIKYFLTESVALDAGLEYAAAFDFPDQGRMGYGVGFSLYFAP